jgi:hypothetical protein
MYGPELAVGAHVRTCLLMFDNIFVARLQIVIWSQRELPPCHASWWRMMWPYPLKTDAIFRRHGFALDQPEQFLGEGSFGRVYACRSLTTDQICAAKCTKCSMGEQSFDNEVCMLKEMAQSHHVVTMLDSFKSGDMSVICLEKANESVGSLLRKRRLERCEARTFSRHLASAIRALHAKDMAASPLFVLFVSSSEALGIGIDPCIVLRINNQFDFHITVQLTFALIELTLKLTFELALT